MTGNRVDKDPRGAFDLIDIPLDKPAFGVNHTDLVGIIDRNIQLRSELRPANMKNLARKLECFNDLERLGIYFVASPRHADVMLLSGLMTFNMTPHVKDAYEQIPAPKWVITLGDCPVMQAPFDKSYAINAPVQEHLPIEHHIAGCPPTPLDILKGFLAFLQKF